MVADAQTEIQEFTQQYYAELKDITDTLNGNVIAFDLARLMYSESRLNPAAVNPYSNATGLIQFMPATADSLGTTVAKLRNMTVQQQLVYVKKYFHSPGLSGKTYNGLGDLYLGIFYPVAVGKPNSYVIGQSPNKVYTQNKVFDIDNDGVITAGNVRTFTENRYGSMVFDSSFLAESESPLPTQNYVPSLLYRSDTRQWLYIMAALSGVAIIGFNFEALTNKKIFT